MGSTQPFLRRCLLVVASIVVASATLAPLESAVADPSNPTPVSAEALPTAQVNGVVWTQVVIGHIAYAGGSFSEAQPPGAVDGQGVVSRSNLLAYDVTTGELVDSFAPALNGQVRGLAASPDGTRLYAVGDFTSVNGVARSRIAALDPQTGAPISGFAPSLNSQTYAVAATTNAVYVGGAFTAGGGQTRPRAAAFDRDGALLPWAPQVADNVVRSIVVSPDRSKLLLGGSFTAVNANSAPGKGMAAVDSASGAFLPWKTGEVIHDGGNANGTSSSIYSLSTRGSVVYATGQATGIPWTEANLEGMVAMNWSDGSLIWIEDCHGDTYSSFAFDDAVYTASHAHYCKNVGGFDEMSPEAHRALGFSQATTHTLAHNTQQGPGSYQDFGGYPAPTLLDWYPTLTIGTYTGSNQAAWSVTAGDGYLLYGGEFTKVNGVRQTGLVRFRGYDDPAPVYSDPVITPTPSPTPPPTPTPTPTPTTGTAKPHRVARPDAIALGSTSVGVKWTAAPKAKTDEVTGYTVSAVKGSKTIRSVQVGPGARKAVLKSLKKRTTYKIIVRARNAVGSSAASTADLVKTKAAGKTVSSTKRPAEVAKPLALAVGAHAIKVSWKAARTAGATPVRHYIVRVYQGGKKVAVLTLASTSRSVRVKALSAATKYTVTIAATNWAGAGGPSPRRGVVTKP